MSGSFGLWTVLAVLLLLSALFSSSETALFSLTKKQRARAGESARRLLQDPTGLLVAVLLGNLVINILFFAFARRLYAGDPVDEVLIGFGALLAILIGGEILPKTVGLRARVRVARFGAPVLSLVTRVLGPLGKPLIRLTESLHGVLSDWLREEPTLNAEALGKVLERGAEEGALIGMEVDLLLEVVELGDVRVREIMTPRVDALFLDVSEANRDEVVRAAFERKQSWLPVVDGTPDRVLGRVHVRDLVRRADRTIRQLVMPVKFIPEVASALDLLRGMRQDRTAEAVVVDEWGGTAGFVTAEDVLEEIVGDLRNEGEERRPTVVPLGEGRFRVAGNLSIRDWNEEFGLSIVPTEFETVGGFVTALLGRIPRAGDAARVDRLEMQVHEVRGRRVQTVDIGLAPEQAAGEGR